jgi:hypothetical protein
MQVNAMLDEHDEKHQSIVLTDSIHASQESMLIFDPGGFISFFLKKMQLACIVDNKEDGLCIYRLYVKGASQIWRAGNKER